MAKLNCIRSTAVCQLICIVVAGICLSLLYSSMVGNISILNTRDREVRWIYPALVLDVHYKHDHSYPFLVTDRESPVDVVIRAVYFDNRTREGHSNSTVFLLDVHSDILTYSLINGCGVAGFRADTYKIRDCLVNAWLRKTGIFEDKKLTHWCIMLDCFDLPVTPGSKAYVFYKHQSVQHVQRGQWFSTTHQIHRIISVESLSYVVFPYLMKPVKRSTDYPFSVTVCRGPVFGVPPLFKEWLHYQRTIGVDHIYLIVEESFIHNNGLELPEVAKALHEGYLTYSVWGSPLDDVRSYYHSQLLATEDCLYRLLGQSDYVFISDTDDFFTPVMSKTSLHYYVDRWCHRNKTCGALNMRWVQRHLECGLKGEIPPNGNITSVLASEVKHTHDIRGVLNYKTIHRTSSAADILVHKHGIILPGFDHVLLPINNAYVSHVRKHTVEEGTRCALSKSERNKSVSCVC